VIDEKPSEEEAAAKQNSNDAVSPDDARP